MIDEDHPFRFGLQIRDVPTAVELHSTAIAAEAAGFDAHEQIAEQIVAARERWQHALHGPRARCVRPGHRTCFGRALISGPRMVDDVGDG